MTSFLPVSHESFRRSDQTLLRDRHETIAPTSRATVRVISIGLLMEQERNQREIVMSLETRLPVIAACLLGALVVPFAAPTSIDAESTTAPRPAATRSEPSVENDVGELRRLVNQARSALTRAEENVADARTFVDAASKHLVNPSAADAASATHGLVGTEASQDDAADARAGSFIVRLATEGDGTIRVNGRTNGAVFVPFKNPLLRGVASPLAGSKFRKWTFTGPNGQETTISGSTRLTHSTRTGGILTAVFVDE